MQNNLEQEKEKVKNLIKDFFLKNQIPFEEDYVHIEVKGIISILEISASASVNLQYAEHKYLFVQFINGKIVIEHGYSRLKSDYDRLEIEDAKLFSIYYFNEALIFLF